ncbi:potassium channel family protein [Rheinheimera sp.]|uniref:potassium channel family protein n=1 Tax=Rheinheimera sp. TaxID=1869214 RepID=UPI0027326D65|nr:potassium channel family protein [Rheinheimera sp.]MDP2714026.1 potassium channel family protein [Rheinheimera sp.]
MFYVVLINCLVVATAVLVHYEFLVRLSSVIPKMQIKHRYKIVFGVFGALVAHMVEIWLFALVYYLMHKAEGWGELTGNFNGSLMDCVYFSSTVFSTVGFGDIVPMGDLRFLTGIESLTGLVLITWSASFLFFEMQRYWITH